MASDKQKKILNMVRNQLQRTKPPSTEALYGRAARIDESIRELSLRQFNARYPLRVRREIAREEAGREGMLSAEEEGMSAGTSSQPDRAALRRLFHDLAAHVVTIETGPGLIDLFGDDLAGYVDRAVAVLTTG